MFANKPIKMISINEEASKCDEDSSLRANSVDSSLSPLEELYDFFSSSKGHVIIHPSLISFSSSDLI